MKQKLANIFLPLLLLLIAYWIWEHQEDFADFFERKTPDKEIVIFDKQVDPYRLMGDIQDELLSSPEAAFLEPQLEYYPFLVMDVDFDDDRGILIWGLNDGEIVRSTRDWEITQGVSESIDLKADPRDYEIIRAIEQQGREASLQQIAATLQEPEEKVEKWAEESVEKGLIAKKDGGYHLHIPPTYLNLLPTTELAQPLVTRTYTQATTAKQNYSPSQVIRTAQNIFGPSFKVTASRIVYLPVYSIGVIHPDGSIDKTFWSAITGKRFYPY